MTGTDPTPNLYKTVDWRDQLNTTRTGTLKQLAYRVMLPAFDLHARRRLSRNTIAAYQPSAVFQERGFPVEARRRWALEGINVKNAVVLVQGTGSGWDVATWAPFRPKRIIATDLFAFDYWDAIARYCFETWNVRCEFQQAPLEDHSFLESETIDICVSDAVFEHCRDLAAVLAESHRVIKRGGRLYAAYGPLWFCGGGDHFSGRGGLHNLYNHLVLCPSDYRKYLERYRKASEDFQDGYRYVELGLFSKLTTGEYLQHFTNAGFQMNDLALDLSSAALQFRTRFPAAFKRVTDVTSHHCSADDLIIKSNLVKLARP